MDRYRRNKRQLKKNINIKIRIFALIIFILGILYCFRGMIIKTIVIEMLPFYNAVSSQDISLKKSFDEAEAVFTDILSTENIIYQPETDMDLVHNSVMEAITDEDMKNFSDINYLKSKFYIVDSRTDLLQSDIDAEKFLNMDLSFENTDNGPKVLIFHTHISEMYSDSDRSKGISEGVYGAGEKLKQQLESKYGIECLHDDTAYDVVNGKGQILGAYERMEPNIRKILEENPSIELVIDLHRDGVAEGTHLVKNINGKDYAQIMFFNGLCRLNENGSLNDITSLPNPYLEENLALSFNLQVAANTLYPQLARKIYINAYRYSLHMMPKSMLVEVGAQTNTKQEAYNSMEALADIIAAVVAE